MNLGSLNRRLSAVVVLCSAVAVVGWRIAALQGADDATPEKSTASKAAAAASDPFAVPDGKPPVLQSFIAKMRRIKPPKSASDDDKKTLLIKSHTAMLEAADKILETKPVGAARLAALKAKVEALVVLDEQGDDKAKQTLGKLADELQDDKQVEVARLVKPYIGMAAKAEVATTTDAAGKTPAGEAPAEIPTWAAIRPKVAAAPDDKTLAQLAIQSVEMLERSGQTDEAVKAYRELGAILAKSKDPQIAGVAGSFEGVIRRLTLPGNPIDIKGTLVDGTPVNTSALRGKVVLVDFWATWCGPCRAELPNVLTNYEKYHAKGFEVVGVSCDSDKDVLQKFIAEQKLPWPIIFQDPQRGEGMADHYGITSIPTAILVNRKGEVISLAARGSVLTSLLEEQLGK